MFIAAGSLRFLIFVENVFDWGFELIIESIAGWQNTLIDACFVKMLIEVIECAVVMLWFLFLFF